MSSDINRNVEQDEPERQNKLSLAKAGKYFQTLKGNNEARAWVYASAAQGVITFGGVVFSIPMLKLAEFSAGCDPAIEGVCSNRVYGFKPSSLLTLMSAISGFLVAAVLPTIGGVIDSTPYRRGIAIATGVWLVVLHFVLVILSETTWFPCAILLTLSTLFYFIHMATLYAYIPELTDDTEKLTIFNSIYLVVRGFTMFPFYGLIGLCAFLILGKSKIDLQFEVNVARIGTVVQSFILIFLYFKVFYKGLPPRPPTKNAAKTTREALVELKNTTKEIYTLYPAFFWFLMALIPFQNTVSALASISVTFVTLFLKAKTVMIAASAGIFGVFNVIGSRVHPLVAKRINLLNDVRLNISLWVVTLILCGFTVNGPDKLNLFMGFTCILGFLFGWIIPSTRSLFFTLMPKGKNAQYMGIYVLGTNGFTWAPPLLFTILNEAGVQMNHIIVLGLIPFAISLLIMTKVGKFEDALERLKEQERLDEEKVMARNSRMEEEGKSKPEIKSTDENSEEESTNS